MTLFQKYWRITGLPALFAAALVLNGCYSSHRPLVGLDKADFPFESLTYVQGENGEEITVVRSADGYVAKDEESSNRVLLKALSDDTYLVQVEDTGDSQRYLYGLITVAPDLRSFVVSAGMAEKADLEAVNNGVPGLSICPEGSDTICIESVDAYLAHAGKSDDTSSFRVLSIQFE